MDTCAESEWIDGHLVSPQQEQLCRDINDFIVFEDDKFQCEK